MIEKRGEDPNTLRYSFRLMGDEYTIKGQTDPAYMEKIAAYLEETVNSIANPDLKLNKSQVAILAALKMADELHQLRQKYQYLDQLLLEAR